MAVVVAAAAVSHSNQICAFNRVGRHKKKHTFFLCSFCCARAECRRVAATRRPHRLLLAYTRQNRRSLKQRRHSPLTNAPATIENFGEKLESKRPHRSPLSPSCCRPKRCLSHKRRLMRSWRLRRRQKCRNRLKNRGRFFCCSLRAPLRGKILCSITLCRVFVRNNLIISEATAQCTSTCGRRQWRRRKWSLAARAHARRSTRAAARNRRRSFGAAYFCSTT